MVQGVWRNQVPHQVQQPWVMGCVSQDPHALFSAFPGLTSISAEAALPCRDLTQSTLG